MDTPHVQRMRDETKALGEKLEKLNEFLFTPLFKGLPKVQQDLMYAQADAMATYQRILNIRIETA